jgi:quinol monooxygenase YgiN
MMKRVMVRYTVKPEHADENVRLIRAVYEQLARERPAGLRYATFRLDDGVSFVHLASHESEGAGNPLTELAAFKTFVAGIGQRCEEPPVSTELHEVGSYAFFG